MLYTVLRFEAEEKMEKRSKDDNCGGGIQEPAGELFSNDKEICTESGRLTLER